MANLYKQVDRAVAIRREILHEIRHGTLSRREMLKKTLYTSGALAALYHLRGYGKSGGGDPALNDISPFTAPFVEELTHVNRDDYVAKEVMLDPRPDKFPVTGEARRAPHQAWDLYPAQKFYEVEEREVKVKFHRDQPEATIWAFDGKFPGPTFHARYKEPIVVRIRNALPDCFNHIGFGMPETTTHLHNLHSPSESDGNPDDYFPRQCELNPAETDRGRFKDHHYVNVYAGVDTFPPFGDSREALGTLWYHDHRHNFTSHNVYKGLAGFYLIFDDLDSGDENETKPNALRLPSGEFDVPLMLGDKLFDSSGMLVFDQFNFDGVLGNKMTVNGKVQPFFQVARRKYRFRLLNSGPSRVYGLRVMSAPNAVGDLSAATDFGAVQLLGVAGNLLPRPLPFVGPGILSPAQRADLVVDFSKAKLGDHLYLVNVWAQSNGRMPDGFVGLTVNAPQFREMKPGVPLMRVDVVKDVAEDPSRVLVPLTTPLRPLPDLPPGLNQVAEADILAAIGKSKPFPGVETVRDWKFDRSNGQWTVNGQLYDGDKPRATVGKGTGEIWILRNSGGSWLHPVHIHFEEFRILYRANGLKPGLFDPAFGREDTLSLGPGERAVIFMRFRDFHGKYVMHCHNVVHEDHAMMIRWDIE